MKNTKKMMSVSGLFNVSGRNCNRSSQSTKSLFSLALLGLLVVASAFPGHARAKKNNASDPETAVGDVRELDWASDEAYSAVEIRSICEATDAKHATWQTDVRNTSDSPLQLKAGGKSATLDADGTIQLSPITAKNCAKPLRMKLESRGAGDHGHYAIEYNNGVVKARYKTPTDWMGMTAAIMSGVNAGLTGTPLVLPDPPASTDDGSSDDGNDN